MTKTVKERLAFILTCECNIAAEKIMPSATLQTLGLTDSLDQIDLALLIELEFDIDTEKPPFDTITTLGELEFEIEKKIATEKRARAA